MNKTTVYDLGQLDAEAPRPAPTVVRRPPTPRAAAARPSEPRSRGSRFDLPGTLSLILPGAGHVARGRFKVGLFFLATLAFLGTLAWALLGTMDRVAGTLVLLGQPRALGVWALGGIYLLAAGLHVGSVLTLGRRDATAPHPAVSGVASMLVPGWGQTLNGDRRRAGLFLGGLWLVGGAWLLFSPACGELLASLRLHLPSGLLLLSSAPVRWTLPAVVLALAVYDAASSAAAAGRAR